MTEGYELRTFHTTFIVKKNKIQKIGINTKKTHPANLKYNYYSNAGADLRTMVNIHSELSAILKYGKEDCSDCTFINVRIDRRGKINTSKPCRGCQDLLTKVGFKRMYFTNLNGEFEEWCP